MCILVYNVYILCVYNNVYMYIILCILTCVYVYILSLFLLHIILLLNTLSLREGKVEPTLFHAKIPIDRSIRPTLECSLCATALALSCVMAGQGDARCLRVLRELRWKVEDINYGSHMAINMAIGKIYILVVFVYILLYFTFISYTC